MKINPNMSYKEGYKSKRVEDWEKTRSADWKEYRYLWNERANNRDTGTFPLNIDIECTRTCNLRCIMCPRTVKLLAGDKIDEGHMTFDMYKKIIDEGAANGLCAIKLCFLGEPLMCPDIVKMVKYAHDNGILDVIFNTNGTLLTADMSRKLIEAGITGIFISIDSPNKEKYESIRIGAKYDNVVQNVKNLVRIRDEMKSFFPIVRVSMTVMKDTESEMDAYVAFWKPVVDIIGFGEYVDPQHKDKLSSTRHVRKLHPNKKFTCAQLYQRIFVHWNGNIGLCCVDYDPSTGLGNISNTTIKDVWNGEKLKEFRRLHENNQWMEMPICARCDFPYI